MKKTVLLTLLAAVAGAALVWKLAAPQAYAFRGSRIEPPLPAPDITLSDQNGRPFRLSEQRGKLVLLFFGYTHCPDVCPTTLGEFARLHRKLGPHADQVRFVFITLDPQRDTPAEVAAFVQKFQAGIIGLSGSEAELQPVWDAYGVVRAVQPVDGPVEYLLDHSAQTYLIDRQGRLQATFPFGMEVDAMLEDVLYLLEQ